MLSSVVSPLDGFRSPFGPPRGFNPARLFGPTDTGWFYDLSDMSTLFQEAAGITPVTAVNQPVGLCLDKSGRGNHRSQSASLPRPTYARHPLGGIRNLLTFTEEFNGADWSKVSSTITANAGVAPDGTTTADNWFFNSGVSLVTTANGLFTSVTAYLATTNPVLLSATAHTYSLYVKAGSGLSHIQLRASTGSNLQAVSYTAIVRMSDGAVVAQSGSTCSVSSAGNGWWRIAMTFTPTANNHFFGVWGWNDTSITTNGTQFYTLWGAQLEPGSTATAYQRVGSVFDVTEAGVPDLYYLSYDGINDFLSTAPFAWGSDKATVVAGVRKLSDAAIGMFAEFSSNINTNQGAWYVTAPESPSQRYATVSRGSTASNPGQLASITASGAAPDTAVITAIHDIAGDLSRIRRNGVAGVDGTVDKGTGNFGTYQTFFGARAGTSLFFNGREYSNFAINRLLTANELTQIERYTAQRTGVTIP